MSVQTPISKAEEEKIQPLFSGAFLGDSKFDQAHNAMFALAHEAFPAGFQAAKPPIFAIKAGRLAGEGMR